MMKTKFFSIAAALLISTVLLTSGCSQTPTLANTLVYKVTTETQRRVDWEGNSSNRSDSLSGGQTSNKIEITFNQDIQSVDNQGNTVAKITITGLKYLLEEKNAIVLDFDNSRKEDKKNPLTALIGKSYTIEITPTGEVSKVIDTNDTLAAVEKSSLNNQTALRLLSTDAIKKRHTISVLPDMKLSELKEGQTWSKIENFSFGLMGSQSYEKTYTLEKIENIGNDRIATARMNAIPSVEKAKELYQEQETSIFSSMSDNKDTYTGLLKLDLTTGQIEEYSEKLTAEWVIVDPAPQNPGRPAALKMTAVQSYSIEKIN